MVTQLQPDPLDGISIEAFGRLLRSGELTSEAVTSAYLARIDVLDPQMKAYEHVARQSAIATARALDELLAAGVDLGPLMGVPIAVKDLFATQGMPTTAGSRTDISDIVGPQGTFMTRLRRAGCVVLGKTKTVEFAFGAVGTNSVRGTPRNPWDSEVERAPGGSSSGSAVAVAAGLCAFAVGSDTGGSIRLPAALCGIFGLKTTVGLWPTDGVFPLSPTLDSIGLLTRSAADAAWAFVAIEGGDPVEPRAPDRLLLGRPRAYLCDDLDPDVARCIDEAVVRLRDRGVRFSDREMAYAREREGFFGPLLASELLTTLGADRFAAQRHLLDPVVAARIDSGIALGATRYQAMVRRHRELIGLAARDMIGIDAWLTPTAALLPVPIEDFADTGRALWLAGTITRNSQPMNLFGQCGTSSPVQMLGSALPVGLQITCGPFCEREALSIALAVEDIVGLPSRPDLSPFLER